MCKVLYQFIFIDNSNIKYFLATHTFNARQSTKPRIQSAPSHSLSDKSVQSFQFLAAVGPFHQIDIRLGLSYAPL